jgi:hypothetical protein
VVCPIKLLLILALRLGNVAAKTIGDVLVHAQSRRDKTVVWKHAERPVFCVLAGSGAALDLDKPAGNHQLTQTLATVGPIAGFLTPVRSHDLRRGSGRDIANLKEGVKGIATPAVAAALGHTNASHLRGVTSEYVGAISESTWSKRLRENYRDEYGIAVTDAAFSKKRKIHDSAAVTAQCIRDRCDAEDPRARKAAAIKLRKQRVDNWYQAEMDRADPPSGLSPDYGLCSLIPRAVPY